MPEPQELAGEAALRGGRRRLLQRSSGTLNLRSDLAHALRQVRHAPAFAAIFAATIALGLGASLTIFMVIDHVFVQPLDVRDASRLVVLQRVAPFATLGVATYSSDTWTREVYQKISSAATVTLAASDASDPLMVDLGGSTVQPRSMFITADYLDLLGVTPALGRAFLPSDDHEGAPVTAILSHALWQTRFGGDRTVLGRVIRVNGSLAEVVGIAPRTFRGTTLDARGPDLLLPFAARAQLTPESVHLPRLRVVGRLAPGATMEQASAEIMTIVERG